MKKVVKRIFGVVAVVLLCETAAFADNTVDGNSAEALQSSVLAVAQTLDEDKKPLFEKAAGYYLAAFAFARDTGNEQKALALLQKVDGLSPESMVKNYAAAVDKEYKATLAQIKADRAYFKEAREAGQVISAFEIMDTVFYYDESGGQKTPMIGLAVYNGTPYVVKQIFLKGEICSVGRVIPWFAEEFNFTVPEGVKLNELADWELKTDNAAGWARIPAEDELRIELKVVKLVTDKGREFTLYPEAQGQDLYLKLLEFKSALLQKEAEDMRSF